LNSSRFFDYENEEQFSTCMIWSKKQELLKIPDKHFKLVKFINNVPTEKEKKEFQVKSGYSNNMVRKI
jgi:hypothetical protein